LATQAIADVPNFLPVPFEEVPEIIYLYPSFVRVNLIKENLEEFQRMPPLQSIDASLLKIR